MKKPGESILLGRAGWKHQENSRSSLWPLIDGSDSSELCVLPHFTEVPAGLSSRCPKAGWASSTCDVHRTPLFKGPCAWLNTLLFSF